MTTAILSHLFAYSFGTVVTYFLLKRRRPGTKVFAFWFVLVMVNSCGQATSQDRARAERVFNDQAGYTCFLVRDEAGKAVGGNCLRD